MADRQWVFQWKSAWVDNFDIPARQAQQKITTNAEPDSEAILKNTESFLWSPESEIFFVGTLLVLSQSRSYSCSSTAGKNNALAWILTDKIFCVTNTISLQLFRLGLKNYCLSKQFHYSNYFKNFITYKCELFYSWLSFWHYLTG